MTITTNVKIYGPIRNTFGVTGRTSLNNHNSGFRLQLVKPWTWSKYSCKTVLSLSSRFKRQNNDKISVRGINNP